MRNLDKLKHDRISDIESNSLSGGRTSFRGLVIDTNIPAVTSLLNLSQRPRREISMGRSAVRFQTTKANTSSGGRSSFSFGVW